MYHQQSFFCYCYLTNVSFIFFLCWNLTKLLYITIHLSMEQLPIILERLRYYNYYYIYIACYLRRSRQILFIDDIISFVLYVFCNRFSRSFYIINCLRFIISILTLLFFYVYNNYTHAVHYHNPLTLLYYYLYYFLLKI